VPITCPLVAFRLNIAEQLVFHNFKLEIAFRSEEDIQIEQEDKQIKQEQGNKQFAPVESTIIAVDNTFIENTIASDIGGYAKKVQIGDDDVELFSDLYRLKRAVNLEMLEDDGDDISK
jgi:hypothetical protein